MRALLCTEFTALLARADVRQAEFSRLASVTARQINNWCRGRAAVPKWAAALAMVLAEVSPEKLKIRLEESDFVWHEVLSVAADADPSAVRRAITKLVLIYHPDTGGAQEHMFRINAAYDTARTSLEDG